jgi:hypothetical protein
VIIREFHPSYDSDPEPLGFHELPPSCIGGVTENPKLIDGDGLIAFFTLPSIRLILLQDHQNW